MSGAGEFPNEFDDIARLFRPLTGGAPGAFDLLDDAAVIESRAGFDLVVTKDAIVEGVHFLAGEAPDLIARKLLRVNLSDLAAKAAEPFAAFLAVAWPPGWGPDMRATFARGLGEDLRAFGVCLMGGDTVSTAGPFTASLTAMGWVAAGRMVRRAGARPGDLVQVSGAIGDGTLGLAAARGEIEDAGLLARYRLPTPRLDLRDELSGANAAADISDGLVADAGHIARASSVRMRLDLERMPLSEGARRWLATNPGGLIRLATGGDDYEIICTSPRALPGFTVIGEVLAGQGIEARIDERAVDPGPGGWTHP
jgi:thiamine-monophosphate kinase